MIGVLVLGVMILASLQSMQKEGMDNPSPALPPIIGYFHVCMLPNWEKSFDMIFPKIVDSGLLSASEELRIGVLTPDGQSPQSLDKENRLSQYPNMHIVYQGDVSEFERPTLTHMHDHAVYGGSPDTIYYYVHTKGITHFGLETEATVTEWIHHLVDCNITNWRDAVRRLETHDTYGCSYNGMHYVGNMWFATSEHIRKLPREIPPDYIGPENWVLLNKDNVYCASNCDGKGFKEPYDIDLVSRLNKNRDKYNKEHGIN